jgi:hypothetical protein
MESMGRPERLGSALVMTFARLYLGRELDGVLNAPALAGLVRNGMLIGANATA